MEPNSHLDGNQACQKSARKSPFGLLKQRIMDYVVVSLILVFFSIPFAGLSVHYYKYGVPSRFLGLVQLFMPW